MNKRSIVGKSADYEAMRQEGQQNLLEIGKFMENLQKQTNNHEERIAGLEDNMRISGVEEMNVNKVVSFD